jgi:2-oxo-3-hexenedioate decarboxylase
MATMPISRHEVDHLADLLMAAEDDRRDRAPLTDDWPELDLAGAYAIQDETLRRRLARGERITGVKVGLTSEKKQQQMKVSSPLTAWLTDAMALRGTVLPAERLIHPRVEPEIVFEMATRLAGPNVTQSDALAAVGRVRCGFEVIDSRYADFRFTLPDVLADNASSALFVLGSVECSPDALDLAAERCVLRVDDDTVTEGSGADVLGHPAAALAHAANTLAERGHVIEPGWIVLTGGMTDAVAARAGARITAEFTNLGSLTLSC